MTRPDTRYHISMHGRQSSCEVSPRQQRRASHHEATDTDNFPRGPVAWLGRVTTFLPNYLGLSERSHATVTERQLRRRGRAAILATGLLAAGTTVVFTPIVDRIRDTFDPQFECEDTTVQPGDSIQSMVERSTSNAVDPRPSVDKTIAENPGIVVGSLQAGQKIVLCSQIPR